MRQPSVALAARLHHATANPNPPGLARRSRRSGLARGQCVAIINHAADCRALTGDRLPAFLGLVERRPPCAPPLRARRAYGAAGGNLIAYTVSTLRRTAQSACIEPIVAAAAALCNAGCLQLLRPPGALRERRWVCGECGMHVGSRT